jgi:hypothetical protein
MISSFRTHSHLGLVLAAAVSTTTGAGASGATKEETKRACIAASERAQELRRTSKLQEALVQIGACVDASCPGPVRDDCAALLTEVQTAMPTLVLSAQDAAGNDVSTVHVTMDGQAFAEKLDGKPLPLDPGEHHFLLQAPSLPSAEKTLVVRQGEKDRRELVILGIERPSTGIPTPLASAAPPSVTQTPALALPPSPMAPATSPASAPQSRAAPPFAPTAPARPVTSDMRVAATPTGVFVLGGIGAAGLLAGTLAGVLAVSKASDLNQECAYGKTACPGAAQSDISSLHTMETASNIGLGLGIAGAAAAFIWWLASGHGEKATQSPAIAWVGVGSAGAAGRF